MKTYIGAKIVSAEPSKGPPLSGGHGDMDGYAVEYADGYRSWSPREAFEQAYHEIDPGEAQAVLERTVAAIIRPGDNGLPPEVAPLVREAKEAERAIEGLLETAKLNGANGRRIAVAATHFETAFMFLVKSLTVRA